MSVKNWTGQDIKALRNRLEIPQTLLGEILGITQKTISQWEKADKSLVKLDKVQLALLERLEVKAQKSGTSNNFAIRFSTLLAAGTVAFLTWIFSDDHV